MKINRLFLLLQLAIFLSGFASLIYEIVWIRMFVFLFGNTSESIAVVISAFMAGLSLGSFFVGKIADRSKNLLRLYAIIESGIAVFGFFSPFLVQLTRNFITSQGILTGQHSSQEIILKIVFSLLILLPPTFFMGATLPVIIHFFNNQKGNLSKQVGRIYGINTLGAVLGVVLTGFIFIELIGLLASLYLAVATNFLAALTAFYGSTVKKLDTYSLKARVKNQTKQVHSFSYSNSKIFFLILSYGLSGLIAISYEVLWTRLITPAAGIYSYGYSLMLAVFLLGIAIGSFLYERILYKIKDTFFLVGMLHILLSLSAFLIIVFISSIMPIWSRYLYRLAVPFIVFLPPTVLMGMMFPAITKIFERTSKVAGKIGTVYAVNSFGSILGGIVAGFILIPIIGTVASVFLLALVSGVIGLLLTSQSQKKHYPIILASGVAVIIINVFGLYNINSIFLPRLYKVYIQLYSKNNEIRKVIKEDSIASILAITGKERKKGKALFIDGVATTGLVEETKMMAHLPLIIHPHPKDVLIIAFGMGTTFRSSLSYPNVNVDVVELVPSIPFLMYLFHPDAYEVLNNPRGRIMINDGRNYVLTTRKQYDIISIDPPPPTNGAGTTVILSQEFYQDAKKKLKKGGVVQSWIHFDLDIDRIKMMLATFENNFPFIAIFLAPSGKGVYVIGSDEPISFTKERLQKVLAIPSVVNDMSEWSGKPYSYEELTEMYLGAKDELKRFTLNSPLISDYHPRTEYSLIRTTLKPQAILTKKQLLENFHTK